MKPAGAFVTSVLAALHGAAAVGANRLDLAALAPRMVTDAGAKSCPIGYHRVNPR